MDRFSLLSVGQAPFPNSSITLPNPTELNQFLDMLSSSNEVIPPPDRARQTLAASSRVRVRIRERGREGRGGW